MPYMSNTKAAVLPPPVGVKLLMKMKCGGCSCISKYNLYQILVLVVTYLSYVNYHASRRPSSVVRSLLHRNCSLLGPTSAGNASWCNWVPFDGSNYRGLYGTLDYAYLFAYSLGLYINGQIAERMNLRTYLAGGMILCGFTTCAFGAGYFWEIHMFSYYVIVEVLAGYAQATGWPAVSAAVGNWVRKGKRGFVTGTWNSNLFVGNIVGTLVSSAFLDYWGWSFAVPALMITAGGIIVALFLVPNPADVGLPPPSQEHEDEEHSVKPQELERQNSKRSPEVATKYQESGDVELNGLEQPVEVESSVNDGSGVVVEVKQTAIENSSSSSKSSSSSEGSKEQRVRAITFGGALCIPGVAEYSICLFFVKLVSYTFLYWLPYYIASTSIYTPAQSAWLSALTDVGGIIGGILIGIAADRSNHPGLCSLCVLIIACPLLWIYYMFGNYSVASGIVQLIILGTFINAPFALITTAVSQDLGQHRSLRGNKNAIATVAAIVDGTGSVGAAVGPLLTGWLSPYGWQNVFYMLIASDVMAAILLIHLVYREFHPSKDK